MWGHRNKVVQAGAGGAEVVFVSQDELRAAIDHRAQAELGKSVNEVIQARKDGCLVVPEKPETSRRVAALTRLLR